MARLCGELVQRDHRVDLITLDDGCRNRHDLDSRVTRTALDVMSVSRNPMEGWFSHRGRVAKLAAAIKTFQADVVLSFCDRNNILAQQAARRAGVPVVLSERSHPAAQVLGRYWEMQRVRSYRKASAVITQSPHAAEHLRDLLRREVHVIPSAVDPDPLVDESPRLKTVIGVGRLEKEKGFERLIAAFAQAHEQVARQTGDASWKLKIYGDGTQRESLLNQARQASCADSIELCGWVRPMQPMYRAASIFALSSHYEGFPSALMEAMAGGMAVVATRCPGGTEQIVRDRVDGLLVDNHCDALAIGMGELMCDLNMRMRLSTAAREVSERFSWASMVDQYERVLSNTAGPTG